MDGKIELAKKRAWMGKSGRATGRVGLAWERMGWQRESRAGMGKSGLAKERVDLGWEDWDGKGESKD